MSGKGRHHNWSFFFSFFVLFFTCSQTAIFAGTYSPVQSSARPFGLSIVDKVQLAGSDSRAASFQNNYLPTMTQWGNMDLTSPSFTQLTSTIALDPSKIKLANAYDTRVYFVGDATTKHNSLGFNTAGGGVTSGNPKLIFPDASLSTSIDHKTKQPVRTSYEPLFQGDFVSLGTQAKGTELDFFLISDRTKKITDVFSTEKSLNPDGLQHALIFAKADSPYLFIAFEDMYGGTPDYKENIFAVDIGVGNVRALTNMPEPSTMFILCSFLALVIYRKYTLALQKESSIT
jgi:hypothetical protein